MSNKIKLGRGTKERIETIKNNLDDYEIVYATDTDEIGVKNNGMVWFGKDLIKITYSELKTLVDTSKLQEGAFYRITDYETTTVQPETRSAGHLFDIIVQALDEKTLSENAFAIHSSRDTYFANSKLEAWELKYCLDNDTNRFAWADEVNGKGVIYRMIDEFNNDVPYDFKNIQFIRDASVISQVSYTISYEGEKYFYTFSYFEQDETVVDTSVKQDILADEGNYHGTYNNYMAMQYDPYEEYSNPPRWLLSNNVMISELDDFYGYYNNTIKGHFTRNTIGSEFRDNVFEGTSRDNIIATRFYNNKVGGNFYDNTIKNMFTGNTIGNDFGNNTIGNYFYYNTIGNYFYYNTIRNYFYYNTIGNGVQYIQFPEENTHSNEIRYLYLRNGLKGASSNNQLNLYYDGLYNRGYPTTFEKIANGNIVSSWEATPLTKAGKVKATNTTATWSDI